MPMKAVAAVVCALAGAVLLWVLLGGSHPTDDGLGDQPGPPSVAPTATSAPPPLAPRSGPTPAPGPLPSPQPSRPVEGAQDTVARGTVIRGVVRDRAGMPVAGAEVSVEVRTAAGPRRLAVVTGPDGAWGVESPADGSATVEIRAAGQPSVRQPVPADGQLDVTLTPPAQIAGRVVDPNGAPVGGGFVRAEPLEEGRAPLVVQTGSDGTFVVMGLSEGGRYRLRASHPAFASGPTEELTAPASDVELRLATGGTLVVRVVGPDGLALPELAEAPAHSKAPWTSLRSYAVLSGGQSARTLSNWVDASRESIRFVGLTPGTYRCELAVRGHGRGATPEVEVVGGAEAEVTAQVMGGGWVDVQVRTALGGPAADTVVQPVAGHGTPWALLLGGVTDGAGQVRLGPFPAGDLALRATGEATTADGSVTVVHGGNAALELKLPESG